MANPINAVQDLNMSLNISDLKDVLNIFPPSIMNGFTMLMTLAKIATVIFIVYIFFLIIGSIVKMRQAHNMKVIARNVEEINKKLDMLIQPKKKSKEKDKDD